MSWSVRSLRFLSALCLALIVYSAIPHLHADAASAPAYHGYGHAAHPAAHHADDATGLAPDDSHDSHSSSTALDGEPCALCRGQVGRELAAPAPVAIRLESRDEIRREWAPAGCLAERLFARRHPARGPPIA